MRKTIRTIYEIGDTIRLPFLRGIVVGIIDGSDRGWQDTMYYLVRVEYPAEGLGCRHIVRCDEMRHGPVN